MKNALEQHVDELGGWYGEHKERVSELEDLINRAVDYLAERDAEMDPDF